MLVLSTFVSAGTALDTYPEIRKIFPGATHMGSLAGEPAAVPIYQQKHLLGYVFTTKNITPIPAYSGKPIDILIGLDLAGNIAGLKIVEHHEPILLAGVSEERLAQYIDQYKGINIFDRVRVGADDRLGSVGIDTISGATITVMVANSTIINSARKVAATRNIPQQEGATETQEAPVEQQTLKELDSEPIILTTPEEPSIWLGEDGEEAIWVGIWRERIVEIIILIISLVILTTILMFQDWVVRHPRLYNYLRHGFLIYTVVFIGGYAVAQLSVVNVLTFAHAFMHDFHWETFALDPPIFILWGFVAVTLLLWGRGIYCGWLCPFGALQELINMVARHFKVRQWEFPYMIHERLWALKYIILIVLFGISIQSISEAERLAEVEPFKTVVVFWFQRSWPFVLYAGGLLFISIFNRKFFCKYLCPLAAALIIPAQNRMFDWVRRRDECGKPCQVCRHECEVQAITPSGEINKAECHYCLDCQVTYWNDHKCPPLVRIRKRLEKRKQRDRRIRPR
ncbi:MAG: 4Fe-4S binding protein [Gammaproteobacteria bacterium]|nr:4Fe-4S binding protein [Gammaproteobacteria bacterium]